MLLFHPQIIQTKGSYSFLLCGMIIACIGFILFIGLLLFHRMHRNYLTGTLSASTLIHHSLLLNFFFSFISYSPPHTPTYLHPNRNDKKVSHGGGSSHRAEWICQNRTERGEHEQLRAAAAVFLSFTGCCRIWSITTVCQQRLQTFYQCLPTELLLLCWKWHHIFNVNIVLLLEVIVQIDCFSVWRRVIKKKGPVFLFVLHQGLKFRKIIIMITCRILYNFFFCLIVFSFLNCNLLF